MSDTPRTDRAQFAAIPDAGRGSRFVVEADFSRQLESELDEANRDKSELQSALRVIVDSLAPSMSFWGEDLPDPVSIGYARGTALRALEEGANA